MSFFKDIGRGFKKAFETIGDVADKVADGVAALAEGVVDVAGDITEGVTRAVAGDAAADKVKNTFDDIVEPAIKRTVKGVASVITTPLAALDDIAQYGLIDGVTKHVVNSGQDMIGGATRLVGGENLEKSFDKVFDEKLQPYIETAIGTVARVGLMFVPGGQLALLADAGSELGSLAYRASNDEKLGVWDYVGAGASVLALGGSAGAAAISARMIAKGSADDVAKITTITSSNATKIATNTVGNTAKVVTNTADDATKIATNTVGNTAKVVTNTADDATKNATNTVGNAAKVVALTSIDDVAKIVANTSDDVATNAINASDDVATNTLNASNDGAKNALSASNDAAKNTSNATSTSSVPPPPSMKPNDILSETAKSMATDELINFAYKKIIPTEPSVPPIPSDTSLGGYATPVANPMQNQSFNPSNYQF